MLLRRSDVSVPTAIEHLVALQAQTPHTAYVGLWSRLEGFRPEHLSDLIESRVVVRIALLRSTIHMTTARDAWALRALVQPVIDRAQKGQFGRRLDGVDPHELERIGRAFVESEPRTFKALGDHLLEHWPGRERMALEQGVRAAVPLVQVPPRGLWGRSGPIAHTSLEVWLGGSPAATAPLTLDGLIRRYLGAFGPASVMDAQAWSGLTRLGEVFERLRPELVSFRDEPGRELFDLPDAPRPDPDTPAPVRFLYDYENMLLSYTDRTRVIPPGLDIRGDVSLNESISSFLLDGSLAGTWKVTRDGRRATLVVKPLVRLTATDRTAVADEGTALLEFLASEATERDVQIVSR